MTDDRRYKEVARQALSNLSETLRPDAAVGAALLQHAIYIGGGTEVPLAAVVEYHDAKERIFLEPEEIASGIIALRRIGITFENSIIHVPEALLTKLPRNRRGKIDMSRTVWNQWVRLVEQHG